VSQGGIDVLESGFVEGDYLETVDGMYFTVKGIHHPENRIIATLRYIPDPNGDREKNGVHYRRVYDQTETRRYLQKHSPQYLSYIPKVSLVLQTVPLDKIKKVYKPRLMLEKILRNSKTELERTVANFVLALSQRSGISQYSFGVTGSLLVGLERQESDVDLNVYGKSNGHQIYQALKKLREEIEWIKGYDKVSVKNVLKSRWESTRLSLELFKEIEVRKVLHGIILGRDYFIRLLRETDQWKKSMPMGRIKLRGIIIDSSESIFTPCKYEIESKYNQYEVSELVSFRGKFTEQAESGDTFEAMGTLEKIWSSSGIQYHLMLGENRDYLLTVEDLDELIFYIPELQMTITLFS
jgi:predicted nucleotidyltransferase